MSDEQVVEVAPGQPSVEVPKRKRGRPKKIKLVTEDNPLAGDEVVNP